MMEIFPMLSLFHFQDFGNCPSIHKRNILIDKMIRYLTLSMEVLSCILCIRHASETSKLNNIKENVIKKVK